MAAFAYYCAEDTMRAGMALTHAAAAAQADNSALPRLTTTIHTALQAGMPRMHTVEEALAIVDAFISTPWSDAPRHRCRVEIMAEYERTGIALPVPGAPS